MSSITLHPEKGVNPFLTFCPRCGGEGRDLILVGRRDYVDECQGCGMKHFGGADKKTCQGCGRHQFNRRKIADGEKLPGGLCLECETEVAEHKAVVAAGGVYFQCADCGVQGVIKANEFTADVRKHHGLTDGEPCGVEFTADDCPKCGHD
jgi:hypothetical protein